MASAMKIGDRKWGQADFPRSHQPKVACPLFLAPFSRPFFRSELEPLVANMIGSLVMASKLKLAEQLHQTLNVEWLREQREGLA